MSGNAREWDATTYDRIATPMTRMGTAVLARLSLQGNETVLDAGCGSGQVTEALAHRLPDGHVIALDGSIAMLEVAKQNLAPFGDRIEYVHANLDKPLPPFRQVDAVLSTATFHWVGRHNLLFANLRGAMRRGGELVAQWGGDGNVASVSRAVMAVSHRYPNLRDWGGPWWFPTVDQVVDLCGAAGMEVRNCWLAPESVLLASREALLVYLATPVLVAHLERLTVDVQQDFLEAVANELGTLTIDYVRMNLDATYRGSV